jgi:hypothetical protein
MFRFFARQTCGLATKASGRGWKKLRMSPKMCLSLLISGDSMLATAVIEAVKHWKCKPYLLNGQTVKVETQLIVNFQLAARESSVEMAAGRTSQQPGQLKWLWTLLTR